MLIKGSSEQVLLFIVQYTKSHLKLMELLLLKKKKMVKGLIYGEQDETSWNSPSCGGNRSFEKNIFKAD